MDAQALADRCRRALTRPLLPGLPGLTPALRASAGALAAAAVTLLTFLPAADNGFVSWDDHRNFLQNTLFRGFGREGLNWIFTSFDTGFYIPVTRLAQALDYHFWGLLAGGYHLTSALLHACAAALLFLLCLSAFEDGAKPGGPRPYAAALLSSLLFALHPLRVESVAWASGKHDLLSAVFCLLTALSYLKFRRAPGRARRLAWNAASFFFFALAMLAKPSAMLLPAALLCADLALFPAALRAGGWRAAAAGKWHLLLAALPAAWTALSGHQLAASAYTFGSYGLAQRLAQAAYGAMFYLWKTVWPFGLSPLYQLDLALMPWHWPYWFSGLAFLALTALLAAAALRGRGGAFSAWAAYLLLLAPASGLAQTGYQAAADRYSYLACLPWALLTTGALLRLKYRPALAAAGAALLLALGALSVKQIGVWRDSVRLWRQAVAVEPYATYSLDNLGDALADAGRTAEAIPYYVRAVIVNPWFHEAHNDLATAYFETGRTARAVLHFQKAVRLRPDYALARLNLANIYLLVLGQPALAASHLKLLAQQEPANPEYRTKLGLALLRSGDFGQALKNFDIALKLNPKNPLAGQGKAAAARQAGQQRK